jgi:hypothetical protein
VQKCEPFIGLKVWPFLSLKLRSFVGPMPWFAVGTESWFFVVIKSQSFVVTNSCFFAVTKSRSKNRAIFREFANKSTLKITTNNLVLRTFFTYFVTTSVLFWL